MEQLKGATETSQSELKIPETKIEKFVCSVSADILGVELSSMTLDQSFYELGGTSIDLYDLITELEDEYDIEIDQGIAQRFKTFEEIVDYLEDIIGGENA